MQKRHWAILLTVLIGIILISGCMSSELKVGKTGNMNPAGEDIPSGMVQGDSKIDAPAVEEKTEATTAEEKPEGYRDAAKGGVFNINDKVEYLGVKGVIVTGKIEEGKVTLEPLQINDPSLPVNDPKAALIVYGSFEQSPYGRMVLIHYVPRNGGEYELYDEEGLVATMKAVKGYSRGALIIAGCNLEGPPESAEQIKAIAEEIVIKRSKECSPAA